METEEIHWRAEEYLFHKKSTDWYWYFGLITIGLMAFSVYAHNTLFAFVIGIGAFTMLLYATKTPKTVDYSATPHGIMAGKTQYPYSELASFWVSLPKKAGEETILLLRSQKMSVPLFVVPLGDADINQLHDFLLNFLEEKEDRLPLGQVFMNFVGF